MESITILIAARFNALRKRRKLSLEAASRLTGVSKSMLAQIERGEVCPTVLTLWKIANGFKVPFTEFLEKDVETSSLVRHNELEPLPADEGRYRNYPMFPFDEQRGFEVYAIEMDPGCRMQAEAHPEGAEEFIIVCCGGMRLEAGGESWDLAQGDALRFRADVPHVYCSTAEELTRLSMVISYPGR